MNERKIAQRGFVALTLITVLSIAVVLVIYATLLNTIPGAEVIVGGDLTGSIQYSLANDETGFGTTVLPTGPTDNWYARLVTTGTEYTGPVDISWQLQKLTAANPDVWTDQGSPVSTTFTLTAGPDTIYANPGADGTYGVGLNYDWSILITESGSYRVQAAISTTT